MQELVTLSARRGPRLAAVRVLIAVLAMGWLSIAHAQPSPRPGAATTTQVRRLGGSTAFCGTPLESVSDLQRVFRTRRAEIEDALRQGDVQQLSEEQIDNQVKRLDLNI